MKAEVREVFTGVLELLIEEGYVKLENYFVDGTKIGADANLHKVVWAKKTAKYKVHLREKIKVLLDEIEKVNEQENEEYGDDDLEEMRGKGGIDAEKLKTKVTELNERLHQQPEDKPLKKAVKTLQKDYLPRLEKYEKQEKIRQGRSSYSQTDPDASCMRMKEDRGAEKPWPHPAYHVQIGTEGQFVVGYSLHQRAGDPGCFIPTWNHSTGQRARNPNRLPAMRPTAAKRIMPISKPTRCRTISSTTASTRRLIHPAN
jgi:hypothetical protein